MCKVMLRHITELLRTMEMSQVHCIKLDAMLLQMGRFNVIIDILKSVCACIIAACCPCCVLLQFLIC